jgi:hypothetical protein
VVAVLLDGGVLTYWIRPAIGADGATVDVAVDGHLDGWPLELEQLRRLVPLARPIKMDSD